MDHPTTNYSTSISDQNKASPSDDDSLAKRDWLHFYQNFDQIKGKGTRKDWYNQATSAYLKARPRYPDAMVDRALQATQFTSSPASTTILEVGCGPGTATTSLARRGYQVVALDPAPQNCHAARQECAPWRDQVSVVESTFEDYRHISSIDAIVCPTSFHWISPHVALKKTAELLADGQPLLLWWALPPMPSHNICERLQKNVLVPMGAGECGAKIWK